MFILKYGLLAAPLLAASGAAFAQRPPDAGRQIQQIPPSPNLGKAEPNIRIERNGTARDTAPAGPAIHVSALRLTGQTLFTESTLIAATGFKPGSELTLANLRDTAAKIASYYNNHGYPLAQAYLPAQDIADGIVTIAVIEGRYGRIELRNQARLSDGVAQGMLHGLHSGDVVATAPLERRLLLLSDIPGVAVNSTLAPGTLVGTSDLSVNLVPDRRVTGAIEADNAGNRYTGAYRGGGTVNFNNPTGHGDVISLRVLASTEGLIYGRAAYQAQVGVATVGVAYAHIDYELGREFKSLDASGTADIASLYASYPLIRSRNSNLYLLGAADAKWFNDKQGLTSSETRRTTRALGAGLSGDFRDDFGGGGWSTYAIGVTLGDLDIRSLADRLVDAATARSNGHYAVLRASASRLQQVAGPLSLYAAARGQLASKNLDSSEKMELGGAYGVRAYPEGESYGDEGYVATVEARLLLPPLPEAIPGRVQFFGFVDVGAVTFAKNPWFIGPNSAHRSAYGAGLIWSAPNNFIVKATYARKLGDQAATSAPDRSGRVWIQLVKLF